MMIFVVWSALLIAGTQAMLQYHLLGDRPEMVCLIVPITYGIHPVFLLIGLIWIFDRPGRVRSWYISTCLIAAHFLGGVLYALSDSICYALTGRPTMIFPMTSIIALVGFWCGWKQWQSACPRQCPRCGHISVVTMARPLLPNSKRLINTGKHGWCATCGATCERNGREAWTSVEDL